MVWSTDPYVLTIQIYILANTKLDSAHVRPRALGILLAINRAIISSQEPIPNIEFSFTVSDIADPSHTNHTIWALSRLPQEREKWLMSDFGYWSWPLDLVGSYEQVRAQIKATESPWEMKTPRAVWRGAAKTNALRKALIKVSKGKEWADVKEVFWKDSKTLAHGSKGLALSMSDHCKYQFLIQTEGKIVLVASGSDLVLVLTTHRSKLLWSREISTELRICLHHA